MSSQPKKKCKATTKKGLPCTFSAKIKSDYCGIHMSENEKIKLFVKEHAEGIGGLIGGAVFEAMAEDAYDALKESIGLKYLVPPVSSGTAGRSQIADAVRAYQQRKDERSLLILAAQLSIGMKRRDSIALLGGSDRESGPLEDSTIHDIYFTKSQRWFLTVKSYSRIGVVVGIELCLQDDRTIYTVLKDIPEERWKNIYRTLK